VEFTAGIDRAWADIRDAVLDISCKAALSRNRRTPPRRAVRPTNAGILRKLLLRRRFIWWR